MKPKAQMSRNTARPARCRQSHKGAAGGLQPECQTIGETGMKVGFRVTSIDIITLGDVPVGENAH
jgi:hypothetical protein